MEIMAKVIGDVCAPTGKYVKDGEEKTSWMKCGVIMQTEKGMRIKLDGIPIGGTEQGIWLSVFEKQESRQSRPSGGQQSGDQDDIPF